MAQGPQTPKYVIPTYEFGFVTYPNEAAVGFQFVDPNGDHVFVAIPGSFVPNLAKQLSDMIAEAPAIMAWKPPTLPE
ncbi:MAG: hypothetical protein K0S28_1150 [Paucimonas sp.]|nr:hypothetical protein [Paucimonas sp.]